MDWIDEAFKFAGKVMAVPELHAILTALAVGLGFTYLSTLPLPAKTSIKFAVQYARVIVFGAVLSIAFALKPTPKMVAYAFPVAIFTPLFYEWLMNILYHFWPWLKPKALLTATEMQARVKAPAEGGD